MLKIKRIQTAIKILHRMDKKRFNIEEWQHRENEDYPAHKTEADFKKGKGTACAIGYIAISPEFQADGGSVNQSGCPSFDGSKHYDAIELWTGIPEDLCRAVFGGEVFDTRDGIYSQFYEKMAKEVTVTDVISKLKMILSGDLTDEDEYMPDRPVQYDEKVIEIMDYLDGRFDTLSNEQKAYVKQQIKNI